MTIQKRLNPNLPWNFPFNARELKPGQHVTMVKFLSEGNHKWELTAIDADTAKTFYERPYHLNHDAEIISNEPQITESVLKKGKINRFGPGNNNWRWIEGKKSKES